MSTQNNTLTTKEMSEDRKKQCDDELVETDPVASSSPVSVSENVSRVETPDTPAIEESVTELDSTPEEKSPPSIGIPAEPSPDTSPAADTTSVSATTVQTPPSRVDSIPSSIQTPSTAIYKPNTLTILINTKIRNHRLLSYKPNMTIPAESSKNVCFDPLVMLNQSVVNDIPPNSPKDEIYTQFFRRNEFNSLLKRTLSGAMQSVYTFNEARQDGVTDNNIMVTLDTLFKQGSPFYIAGEPYIINSYDWVQGDWEVDTRPHYDQQIRFLPYGVAYPKNYIPDFGKQAKRERDTIPPEAIKGDALESSSKIRKAIHGAVSTISHEPKIQIGNDIEVKKYGIPDIAEMVEIREKEPNNVPVLVPDGDLGPIPGEDESSRPGIATTPSADLQPVPEPEPQPAIVDPEPIPEPELVSVPSTIEPEPIPEPEPEPSPDPSTPEPKPKPAPAPISPISVISDDDTDEDIDVGMEEKKKPGVFPEVPGSPSQLDITDPESRTPSPPASVRQVTDETEEEKEERKKREERRQPTRQTFLDYMPLEILSYITSFAAERPQPGDVLYEQLETIFIQQAARGFYTSEQTRKLFQIEKNSETGKPQVVGVAKVNPNTNKPPGLADQLKTWGINENDGKGDCLFLAISQLLNGNTTTVDGKEYSSVVPRIAKRKRNGDLSLVTHNSVKTNPYLYDGFYTAQTVRRALGDYLRVDTDQFTIYLERVNSDLPRLVQRQDAGESLSQGDKTTIMEYKFMLNDDNTKIEDPDTILDIMMEPADEKNIVDAEKSNPSLRAKRTADKYYWGEDLTLLCLEIVFNTKLMVIQVPEKNQSIARNTRVEFKESGEVHYGTVRKIVDNVCEVITNDYTSYQKQTTELTAANLYSLSHFSSLLTRNTTTVLGYLLFHQNGSQGHYEAIYRNMSVRKKEEGRRVPRRYLFSIDTKSIPSYMVYLMFQSVCQFNEEGRFVDVATDPVYYPVTTEMAKDFDRFQELDKKVATGKITPEDPSGEYQKYQNLLETFPEKRLFPMGEVGTAIRIMYQNYQDRLSGVEPPESKKIRVQFGGQVKQYVTTYLQNSMNTDTKNTYYVVIDLDLYPGTSLTSGQRYRMSCANNYDRMRSAWADIWGLTYEPGELDASSVQAIPMVEAEPVASKIGGRRRTLKHPAIQHVTRRRYAKGSGIVKSKKNTIKRAFKMKHTTRRARSPR